MAKEKYYSTSQLFYNANQDFIEKYSIINHHRQWHIVCKTTSLKKANEIIGGILGDWCKPFKSNYTSETGNKNAIEAANKFGVAVQIDSNCTYVDLREMVSNA